jgi:hypothetical protein
VSAPRRRRRHGGIPRRLVWALAFVLVFLVGIALGQALEDNPPRASTTTQERTFTLLPEASTVTVTTP